MRAKVINEENQQLGPKQFGPYFCMKLIKEHMEYLLPYNPEYTDLGDRNYPEDEIGYGDDEVFEKWDFVELNWDVADKYSNGLTLLICKYPDEEIGVKFYSDTVSYDGERYDDEYVNYMDPIPLSEMDEERFDQILDQMREHWGVKDDEEGESDYPDDMVTGWR